MRLTFFGKDPETDSGKCPSVWVDESNGDLVLQGWKGDAATEAECLKVGDIPDHEAVIRLPARMTDQIRKACDAADHSAELPAGTEL